MAGGIESQSEQVTNELFPLTLSRRTLLSGPTLLTLRFDRGWGWEAYVFFFFCKTYLFERQSNREGKRALSSPTSSNCQVWARLKLGARTPCWSSMCIAAVRFSAAFSGSLSGSWMGSGIAFTYSTMGCLYPKQQLNRLHHAAGPNVAF